MGNDLVQAELQRLERMLVSARESLRAVTARLPSATSSAPEQEQPSQLRLVRAEVDRMRLLCASLLQTIESLQHRVNGRTSTPADTVGVVTPEMLEWARAQPVNDEEIADELRDVEKTGGSKLSDFLHELAGAAGQDD
jgi:galactose-1-phosphate uridylyltransferase